VTSSWSFIRQPLIYYNCEGLNCVEIFDFFLQLMRDTVNHPYPHLERHFTEKDCMTMVKPHVKKDVPENRYSKTILFKTCTFFIYLLQIYLSLDQAEEQKGTGYRNEPRCPFLVQEVRTVNIRTELCKAGGFILNCAPDT